MNYPKEVCKLLYIQYISFTRCGYISYCGDFFETVDKSNLIPAPAVTRDDINIIPVLGSIITYYYERICNKYCVFDNIGRFISSS